MVRWRPAESERSVIDTTPTQVNVQRDRSRPHCGKDQWKWDCPACNNGAIHLPRDAAYGSAEYHWASCAALQRNRLVQLVSHHGGALAPDHEFLSLVGREMHTWRRNWEPR